MYDQETSKLNKIISELKLHDEELTSKISGIEEENEFLVTQIQHLLKQEVENSKTMLETIHELEDKLLQKEQELAQLRGVSNQ